MKQEGLAYFTDTQMVVLGLLIFFLWFLGMLLWVNRKSARQQHDQLSLTPLRDEVTL
jgi:cbb3-type cytochrome oxidase subunit 3